MRLEELLSKNGFKPYGLIKPENAKYILFSLEDSILSEQYIWEFGKSLEEQNNKTINAIKAEYKELSVRR